MFCPLTEKPAMAETGMEISGGKTRVEMNVDSKSLINLIERSGGDLSTAVAGIVKETPSSSIKLQAPEKQRESIEKTPMSTVESSSTKTKIELNIDTMDLMRSLEDSGGDLGSAVSSALKGAPWNAIKLETPDNQRGAIELTMASSSGAESSSRKTKVEMNIETKDLAQAIENNNGNLGVAVSSALKETPSNAIRLQPPESQKLPIEKTLMSSAESESTKTKIELNIDTMDLMRSIEVNGGDLGSAVSSVIKGAPSTAIKLESPENQRGAIELTMASSTGVEGSSRQTKVEMNIETSNLARAIETNGGNLGAAVSNALKETPSSAIRLQLPEYQKAAIGIAREFSPERASGLTKVEMDFDTNSLLRLLEATGGDLSSAVSSALKETPSSSIKIEPPDNQKGAIAQIFGSEARVDNSQLQPSGGDNTRDAAATALKESDSVVTAPKSETAKQESDRRKPIGSQVTSDSVSLALKAEKRTIQPDQSPSSRIDKAMNDAYSELPKPAEQKARVEVPKQSFGRFASKKKSTKAEAGRQLNGSNVSLVSKSSSPVPQEPSFYASSVIDFRTEGGRSGKPQIAAIKSVTQKEVKSPPRRNNGATTSSRTHAVRNIDSNSSTSENTGGQVTGTKFVFTPEQPLSPSPLEPPLESFGENPRVTSYFDYRGEDEKSKVNPKNSGAKVDAKEKGKRSPKSRTFGPTATERQVSRNNFSFNSKSSSQPTPQEPAFPQPVDKRTTSYLKLKAEEEEKTKRAADTKALSWRNAWSPKARNKGSKNSEPPTDLQKTDRFRQGDRIIRTGCLPHDDQMQEKSEASSRNQNRGSTDAYGRAGWKPLPQDIPLLAKEELDDFQ